jgi:hypothetical protein
MLENTYFLWVITHSNCGMTRYGTINECLNFGITIWDNTYSMWFSGKWQFDIAEPQRESN